MKKNLVRAMAISGAFAGLGGAVDMLGYLYHYGSLDVQNSAAGGVGFIGIAVALLGRNTAVGVFLGSVLFGGLIYGTNQGLDLERDPAGARGEPDADHPGARRAVHRRRPPHPLRLELAQEAAPEAAARRLRRKAAA